MNRLRKIINEISLQSDKINAIWGIALVISLLLVFFYPNNQFAILAACIFGGLMNIMNGIKYRRDPMRKTIGMTFIMMGLLIIFLGFFLMNMIKIV